MSFMRKIFGRDIKSDVVAVSGTVLRVGTDTDYAEWRPALAPAASLGLTLKSTGSGEGQYGWSAEKHSLIASFNWIDAAPLASGFGSSSVSFYVDYTSSSYSLTATDKRSLPSYHSGAMSYVVSGLTCGAAHPTGHEVFIRGLIQIGATIEQGDSAIYDPEIFLRIVDGSNVLIQEIPLALVKKAGNGYVNSLTQNSVQYYIDQSAIINFGSDTIQSTIRMQIRVHHLMDMAAGSTGTGISAIESVLLNIHYM